MTACKSRLVTITMFMIAAATARADIIYDVIPYGGFSSGWSLDGGSITTDGTIGPITFDNFVDYLISITSPEGSYTLDPSNSFSFFPNDGSVATMIATEQDLIMPSGADPTRPAGLMITNGRFTEGIAYFGGFNGHPGYIWLTDVTLGLDEIKRPAFAQDFSIATSSVIPEPSTVWLVTTCLGATTLVRRRRSTTEIN